MGTTLTGTTPANTYDSLIKVTDNGPISATAKYLSDGLGNDSVLALSTARVGIGTNNPSVNLHIYGGSAAIKVHSTTNESYLNYENSTTTASIKVANNDLATILGGSERMRITSTGNVGIGTSLPSEQLNLMGANVYTSKIRFSYGASNTDYYANLGYNSDGNKVYLQIADGGSAANIMTWNYDGNVGIGTTAPTRMLEVASLADDGEMQLRLRGFASTNSYAELGRESLSTGDFRIKLSRSGVVITPLVIDDQTGVIAISTGIKFPATQVAQADANTLDDYEEGTWTMGVTFGGNAVGVIATSSLGTYTKIGRQVTVNGYLGLTSKGSSTGDAAMTGLPFTIANSASTYNAGSFRISNISFASQYQGFGDPNTTIVRLEEVNDSTGGVTPLTDTDFANNGNIMISLTYFV